MVIAAAMAASQRRRVRWRLERPLVASTASVACRCRSGRPTREPLLSHAIGLRSGACAGIDRRDALARKRDEAGSAGRRRVDADDRDQAPDGEATSMEVRRSVGRSPIDGAGRSIRWLCGTTGRIRRCRDRNRSIDARRTPPAGTSQGLRLNGPAPRRKAAVDRSGLRVRAEAPGGEKRRKVRRGDLSVRIEIRRTARAAPP